MAKDRDREQRAEQIETVLDALEVLEEVGAPMRPRLATRSASWLEALEGVDNPTDIVFC